jgi:WD domain, G-beta repeat.
MNLLVDPKYKCYRFQVVKFSPDGTLLALGSRDNNIYVYQVSEEARKYSRVGRCMVSFSKFW